MTTAQWVTVAVIGLWPVVWHLASPLGNMLIQRLPATQQKVLLTFATLAVRQVEQVSEHVPNEAKKQIAMTLAIRLFKVFHVPLPPTDIVDAAVEAAVSALPPTKLEQ